MKLNKLISITIIFTIFSSIIFNLIISSNTYAVTQNISTSIDKIDDKKYPGVKKLIKELQKNHPKWKFKVLYTNLSWNTVIANEYVGHGKSPKNLSPANMNNYSGDWICSICGNRKYDSGSWVCASESAIKYMMDPRNSLNELDIFQFQELTYDNYNEKTIKSMVKETFIDNTECIKAIKDASKTYNVSPYYIVARILQEQGKSGSVLTKGKGYNGKYKGVYNIFNIGANGNGKSSVIENGLKTAQKNKWTSLALSIKGGVEFISKDYIKKGQNTLYFQKFDVENSDNSLYWHQYMQNILAAQEEGENLRETYLNIDETLNSEYTFIIPLYEDMPNIACARPSTTSSVVSTDLVRVNVNTNIKLRKEPNGSSINEYLYKDEIVTRLEKATKKVGGTYWDKIMKSNGIVGYVARQTDENEKYKLYLVPINDETNENNEENNSNNEINNNSNGNNAISNKKVKLDKDTSIVTIIPGTKVSDIIELLGKDTVIVDANKNKLSSSKIAGTGCRVDDKYTIAMLGDLNGDATINSGDLLLMKKYLLGTHKFTKVSENVAIDVNNDGNVNSGDLLMIKKQLLGTSKISL